MTDSDPAMRRQLTKLLQNPGAYLDATDPEIRRVAVAASQGHKQLIGVVTAMLASDPVPIVRRECAELLGLTAVNDPAPVQTALDDADPRVREAAANALGEIASKSSVPGLVAHAEDEAEDKLVREAAVAALGAIGDRAAVPTLLALIANGPPQIRRRCVAALSVFDGDDVETALRAAATDRNPMVREAAEMVVGRTAE